MKNNRKTIVLFDFNWHGHHPMYLKIFTKLLLETNHNIWLCCQKPDEICEWLKEHSSIDHYRERLVLMKIKPVFLGKRLTLFQRGLINWFQASRTIQRQIQQTHHHPDLVFFLKLDDYIRGIVPKQMARSIFPYPWAGLFIHLDLPRLLNFSLNVLKLDNCRFVGTLQENLLTSLKALTENTVVHFPDFTYESLPPESSLSKEIIENAKGRKIVSLLGGQARRKGMTVFYEVAKRTRHENWFFLFAGRMGLQKTEREVKSFRQFLEKQDTDNCYFCFENITDGEFNELANISDVIFSVYKQFSLFSSNLMTKAALFQKPILTQSNTLMSQRVDQYRIGKHCEADNIEGVIAALDQLLRSELTDPQFSQYFQQNSQESLKSLMLSLLSHV